MAYAEGCRRQRPDRRPAEANPGEVAAMQGMGAEVISYGAILISAGPLRGPRPRAQLPLRPFRRRTAVDRGVATGALERLTALPDPGGDLCAHRRRQRSGGGALGGASGPTCRVIGVQAERSPAAYLSWREATAGRGPQSNLRRRTGHGAAGFRAATGDVVGTAQGNSARHGRGNSAGHVMDDRSRITLGRRSGAAALAAAYRLLARVSPA